jgi:hypothetical protein
MFDELRPVFTEIDSKIAEILGISIDVDELVETCLGDDGEED